jgi:hypothetical protein
VSNYAHQTAKIWDIIKIGRSKYQAIGRMPDGVMLWKGSGPTIYTMIENAQGEWGLGRYDNKLFAQPIAQQFTRLAENIRRYVRAQQKRGSAITPGGIWRNSSVRKNVFAFNNPPSGPADPTAAHELELYIENDADLYRQQFIPIVKNLMLKRRKGIYDSNKAVTFFMYLMESGAKKYINEFGTRGAKIDTVFNKNTRLQAAKTFRDSFETEAELGNYDRLIGPVSNPRGKVRRNIFTFNNPKRPLNAMEQAAAAVGLYVTTWAPGDGLTRYRFFTKPSSYDEGSGLYTAKGRGEAMSFIKAYGIGRGRKNPLTRSEAGYLLKRAHEDVRDAGSLKRMGFPHDANRSAAHARGIGYAVQETGPKAARKTWVELHSRLDRVLHNPVCSNPVIRGDKLPYRLQQQVLARFVYRWTTGNSQRESAWRGISGKPTIPLISDAQWLKEHAFHVTKAGQLDARHAHAEPHYMADDARPNPLLQTVMLANPPISAKWNTMTPRQRLHALMFVGFPEDFAGSMARRLWMTLSSSARTALERAWYDTSVSRGGTTRRMAVPVGANPRKPVYRIEGCKIPYGSVGLRRMPGWRTFRSPSLEAARAEANRIFQETGIVVAISKEGSRGNPLTRQESGKLLREANTEARHASYFRPGHTRSQYTGSSIAKTGVVMRMGPRAARRAAQRIQDRAAHVGGGVGALSNPGTLRLPAPGTKMTVAQAMNLARRIGDRSLIKECEEAAKLQTKANSHAKSVTWKHLPMGSKDKIDSVVALTHYGDSPEDMYRPPKGSKKGSHMYRHKWGDGTGRSKPVQVLASPSGKMIVKVMGPGQKVGDWMRG